MREPTLALKRTRWESLAGAFYLSRQNFDLLPAPKRLATAHHGGRPRCG